MALSQSDLVFVLSGGISNDKPEKSLGGYPSPVPITNKLENLFATLTSREVSDGKIDYRCFYAFNDNLTNNFYNTQMWIEKIDPNHGTLIKLGLAVQNEIQQITFSPNPGTSGSFIIKLDDNFTSPILTSNNPTTLANNLQVALRLLPNLGETTVVSIDSNHYKVYFAGDNANRSVSLMTYIDNTISPSAVIQVDRIQSGSPINTIASLINNEITTPTGVNFFLVDKPGILIGTIKPSEGMPIWIQRITNPGTNPIANDGFSLHIKISSTIDI